MTASRCETCANRGALPPRAQDTYCDFCIWQGADWRKDHYVERPLSQAVGVRDAGPAAFGGRNAGLRRETDS